MRFSTGSGHLAIALLFIAALLSFPHDALAQTEQVVDEVVAVVSDRIVLRSEVDAYAMGVAQQQGIPMNDDLWRQALDQIVDQKVLAAHARRDTTIEISDAQVTEALDQRVEQMTAQVGGQTQLEELYGQSVVQIKNDLREEFREQMLAEEFRNRKLRVIKVTPTEVRNWFERIPEDSLPTLPEIVRLAHIVRYPQITEQARRDAQEVITAIRDSVVAGTSTLEDMARRFSDDLASARNGGRDQDRNLRELVPEFAAVAGRIPIGEISQVFETQFGLHILRVNERVGDVIDYNHILVRFDQSKADPGPAIEYLNTVRDSILTHDIPFELMARRHSEETATANGGGRVVDPRSGSRDLPLEALGTTWRRTIASLEKGEISQAAEVETLDGRLAYHILLLQERTPSHRVSLASDYERISSIVLQEKQLTEMRRWLDELRDDVYVEMRGKARELAVADR